MDFLSLCRNRYSARQLSPEPVPEEMVNRILEAGRLAPSAMNYQPVRILCIRSEEKMNLFRQTVHPCFGASMVLVVCADKEVACHSERVHHNLAEMDATIAATHMMLEATSLGLGCTWVCAFQYEGLRQSFPLPDSWEPYMILPIGYKDASCAPSPRHEQRNPLSSMVTFL